MAFGKIGKGLRNIGRRIGRITGNLTGGLIGKSDAQKNQERLLQIVLRRI